MSDSSTPEADEPVTWGPPRCKGEASDYYSISDGSASEANEPVACYYESMSDSSTPEGDEPVVWGPPRCKPSGSGSI